MIADSFRTVMPDGAEGVHTVYYRVEKERALNYQLCRQPNHVQTVRFFDDYTQMTLPVELLRNIVAEADRAGQ